MVHLIIKTDNAAFQDGEGGAEVARILREVAETAAQGRTGTFKLHDINGNMVGSATITLRGVGAR